MIGFQANSSQNEGHVGTNFHDLQQLKSNKFPSGSNEHYISCIYTATLLAKDSYILCNCIDFAARMSMAVFNTNIVAQTWQVRLEGRSSAFLLLEREYTVVNDVTAYSKRS